jgi:hypothetical protein
VTDILLSLRGYKEIAEVGACPELASGSEVADDTFLYLLSTNKQPTSKQASHTPSLLLWRRLSLTPQPAPL